MRTQLQIGEVAQLLGITPKTIRHYHKVEGVMETLMQEEAPVTPKRMWLLNMGLGLLVGMFLLMWKLPPLWTIVSLVLVDVGIMLGMRQFGYVQLRRLVL